MPGLTAVDVAKGLLIFIATKLTVDVVIRYRRSYIAISGCPGRHVLFINPFRTFARVVGTFFPPRGYMAHEKSKFSLYAKAGSTALSAVLLSDGSSHFWFADPEALKIVTSDRHTYRKEVEAYDVLDIYGKNLVSTDGNEWRRHRAVAGPAFNEANYAYTWSESARFAREWFAELDEEPDVHTKDGKLVDIVKLMTQVTLLIISAAGFGQRTPWSAYSIGNINDEVASFDFTKLAKTVSTRSSSFTDRSSILPFHVSLLLTLDKLFTKILTPNLFYAIPFRVPWLSRELDVAKVAFDNLRVHMLDLVSEARNKDQGERGANILTRLVQANDAMQAEGVTPADALDGKKILTDDEMLSDVFTFLLAGHETSSHTLGFTFLLLALYPDVQKKLHEETVRIWPKAEDSFKSTYREHFDRLEYTLATFRETLRCLPAEPLINKIATKDVTLPATRFLPTTTPGCPADTYDGIPDNVTFEWEESREERISVHIPAGSSVTMDVWGLQMNPLVWGKDAHIFKPERFIDTEDYKWPRDGFLAFSAGARGCIGQKFSTVESVCLLAIIARHYEIMLPEDHNQERTEELKRRALKWIMGITLTPTNPNIRLRRYADADR